MNIETKTKNQFVYTTCSKLGIFMYWTGDSKNNLLSYYGLVDAKIRAFDNHLPVNCGTLVSWTFPDVKISQVFYKSWITIFKIITLLRAYNCQTLVETPIIFRCKSSNLSGHNHKNTNATICQQWYLAFKKMKFNFTEVFTTHSIGYIIPTCYDWFYLS